MSTDDGTVWDDMADDEEAIPPTRIHWTDFALAQLEIPYGIAQGVTEAIDTLQTALAGHANWLLDRDDKRDFEVEAASEIKHLLGGTK